MRLTEACHRVTLVDVMTLGPRLNYGGQHKINETMEFAAEELAEIESILHKADTDF